jgi:O-antigen/teichoic acid export membrane protein
MIQAVLQVGWNSSGWALLASNQHRQLALWAVANGVVTIALACALAPRWGTRGAALASLTGDLICGLFIYPALASKVLGVAKRLMFETILTPIVALIPLLAIAYSKSFTQSITYAQTLLLTTASAILTVGSVLWAFRANSDRELIASQLRSITR